MLRLGFVFVRLHDLEEGHPFEAIRVAEPLQGRRPQPRSSEAIKSLLEDRASEWPSRAQILIRNIDLFVASAPLGLRGEIGIVVAGSPRSDLPIQAERIVLDAAANRRRSDYSRDVSCARVTEQRPIGGQYSGPGRAVDGDR